MKTNLSKADAIRIVTAAAKEYKEKLDGKNLLFVCLNEGQIETFETLFRGSNFQHLTGIEMIDADNKALKNPKFFYSKCLKGKLKETEIRFKEDGTTELKLNAITSVVRYIDKSKMTGPFNGTGLQLVVDRLVGTTSYCIGLTMEGNYYAPSSCLLEDVRKLTNPWSRILAVFEKQATSEEKEYTSLRYVAKDYTFSNEQIPAGISEITDIFQNQVDKKHS